MKSKASLLPVALTVLVALAGCSGIPLATMWHFRNFGPKDLLHTDPTLIRAALQLDNGITVKDVKGNPAKLDVRFRFTGESPQKYSLPLTVLREGSSLGTGVGKAVKGKHWYLLALSPEGVQAFRDMRQDLSRHLDASGHFKEHAKINLTVQTGHIDLSAAAQKRVKKAGKMFLKIRLELSPKDGFYTLYEGKVPFSMSGKGG